MKRYISFTSILFALKNQSLTFEELDHPTAYLCLGCAKEHVLGNYVPKELCLLKGENYDLQADPQKLSPEVLILWNRLRMTLERADQEGRVSYKIGNYPAFIRKCHRDTIPVWWVEWHQPDPNENYNEDDSY